MPTTRGMVRSSFPIVRIESGVVPAHPISGLPEIGSLSAHVGYSRHALGTHRATNSVLWNMGPRLRGDDSRIAAPITVRGDDSRVVSAAFTARAGASRRACRGGQWSSAGRGDRAWTP